MKFVWALDLPNNTVKQKKNQHKFNKQKAQTSFFSNNSLSTLVTNIDLNNKFISIIHQKYALLLWSKYLFQ